ncbi:transposase [Natranaerofaba carboxydovora]|uniref:transposase n=1 Tax=Natranaerofaba carboxydovora TaxID=2742683 RepID=UPI001F12A5B1|nr:transposase [Natranaerofaba carboxydovora]UMZ74738.1 Transposase IS200 like protein [Natranaerofaba carboxydovora]
MPRQARKKSKSRIYHVILRGTNRKEIFHDDEDRIRYLGTLKKSKNNNNNSYKVLGWCLMSNHLHLLLQEGEMNLAEIIKRTAVSYVRYYNHKYYNIGHLFQDRFRSEPVENEAYLLTVIRYIHQNPVKAGMVKKPVNWKWSSCRGYYKKNIHLHELLDVDIVLGTFSKNRKEAIELFKEFNEAQNTDTCLDDMNGVRLTDEKAREEINKVISSLGLDIKEVQGLAKRKRDKVLLKIKELDGVTQRQAARILEISPSMIFKAKKE